MKRKRKPVKKGAAATATAVAAAASSTEAPAPQVLSASKQRRAAKREAERAAAAAGEDPEVSGAAAVAAVRAAAETKAAGGKKKGKVLRKKRRVPQEEPEPESDRDSDSDDDDDDDDDEEEGGESEEGDVDVDFEFFDPTEADYHSVGDLVKNGTWEFVELNFSELQDSIVGQGNIGTLVKSGADDPDPERDVAAVALFTTLNMRQFAHQSWPKAISSALLSKAKTHATAEAKEKLDAVLGEKRKEGQEVGLLFSERFVNLPGPLVPPLHKALVDDIEWSCTTPECPPEEKPFYAFTHFVGVARCFEAPPQDEAEKSKPGKKKRKGVVESENKTSEPWFPRREDQEYWKKAVASFSFPVASNAADKPGKKAQLNKGKGKELRAVFLLSKKGLEQSVANVEKAFQEEEAAEN